MRRELTILLTCALFFFMTGVAPMLAARHAACVRNSSRTYTIVSTGTAANRALVTCDSLSSEIAGWN